METRRTPLRYLALQHLCLPLAIPVYRRLTGTWTCAVRQPDDVARFLDSPRAVVLTLHGMLPHLPAFLPELRRAGRRPVVLLSASDDGRLLAAALARLGIDSVVGSDEERGVGGALELARRIRAGDVAIIAVDGPLGPRGIVKPGPVRLALQQEAAIGVALTSADRGWTFRSWDAAHLPYTRARLELDFHWIDTAAVEDWQSAVARITDVMRGAYRPPVAGRS